MSQGQELSIHACGTNSKANLTLTFDVLSQKLQTQDPWHTVPKFSFFLEFPLKKEEESFSTLH